MNAKRIYNELKEKAKKVEWNIDIRKEKFTIFAKSFKIKEKNLLLYDLKDY